VPLAGPLVVKKGSKILERVCASVPVPVSLTGVLAGPDIAVRQDITFVKVDVPGLDRDVSAARHGVACVDDHLLNLPRVRRPPRRKNESRADPRGDVHGLPVSIRAQLREGCRAPFVRSLVYETARWVRRRFRYSSRAEDTSFGAGRRPTSFPKK